MSAPLQVEEPGFHGLWSLMDMLKDNAADFVDLGQELAATQLLWTLHSFKNEDGGYSLDEEGTSQLRLGLAKIFNLAQRLGLPTSRRLVGRRLVGKTNLPRTVDEFRIIEEVLNDDLASKLFLFVPTERAAYWEKNDLLTDKAKGAFPNAAAELRAAGNSFAAALPEGTVYYSMRALEHGLRALSTDVGKTFDTQQWGEIIDQIEAQITDWSSNGIPGLQKADKNDRLQFLSAAAKEFSYFKDGWRNYAAHAKVRYTEPQALTVLNHVVEFTERLSDRLAEQS